MSKITRYDYGTEYGAAVMYESEYGDYVWLEDHEAAILAERERCAKIIEARIPLYTDIGQINALRECLNSIRGDT